MYFIYVLQSLITGYRGLCSPACLYALLTAKYVTDIYVVFSEYRGQHPTVFKNHLLHFSNEYYLKQHFESNKAAMKYLL
jgi:hypothetical protein